jgi:hypothetical protein
MPTFEITERFRHDLTILSKEQKAAFKLAKDKFVADLKAGRFRKGLRIKAVQGASGIFEMTWAPNGRATFSCGPPIHSGEPHIIWRRIGTHDIFGQP